MIILLKFLRNIFDVTQGFKIVMKWEIRVRYKNSLENLDSKNSSSCFFVSYNLIIMEALSLPTISVTNSNSNTYISLSAATNYASLSSLQHRPSSSTKHFTMVGISSFVISCYMWIKKMIFVAFTLQKKSVVLVKAENEEDFELKQVRDMAAARKRWEALVGISPF